MRPQGRTAAREERLRDHFDNAFTQLSAAQTAMSGLADQLHKMGFHRDSADISNARQRVEAEAGTLTNVYMRRFPS